MSLPRHILGGVTWFITRRVTRRHFLLRPDADGTVQQIYWYCTAVMAAKFGIELHAVQMLSTHLHEVLTDMRGVLPSFLGQRNRLVANAVKVHRNWPEEVFQRAAASCVQLHGADAVLKEIGYTLANVVDAGLVEHPEQWPGVTVSVNDIGERIIEVERPSVYFDPENPQWPERVSIRITMPPALIETFGAKAKEVLVSSVHAAVERAREAARSAGRFVKTSAAKLCKVPITRQSTGFSPFGSRNPTFATGGNNEMATKARAERKQFHELYRRALDALKKGITDIPFPSGTWRWARELLPDWLLGGAASGSKPPEGHSPERPLRSVSVESRTRRPLAANDVAGSRLWPSRMRRFSPADAALTVGPTSTEGTQGRRLRSDPLIF
ncbi:hypothetical protein AKJ09_09295 [Labilithrix luteola]|uniref:Transposase n=1 Tax=Labilithrix luteola TaxID=1391654 RepID=A0A0K1QAC9_9BACT|nr:transposase [Labilithrix luteola]AKV02632.1 hypothetical protein AKJ09_09295 [Labilithrix luteola]